MPLVEESYNQQQISFLKYTFLIFDNIYLKLCNFSSLEAEETSSQSLRYLQGKACKQKNIGQLSDSWAQKNLWI